MGVEIHLVKKSSLNSMSTSDSQTIVLAPTAVDFSSPILRPLPLEKGCGTIEYSTLKYGELVSLSNTSISSLDFPSSKYTIVRTVDFWPTSAASLVLYKYF